MTPVPAPHCCATLALLAAGLLAAGAHAQEWSGNVAILPSIIYTDNVCLSKDNKKDDFTGVLTVAPVGDLTWQSSRTTATLLGSVSVNTLTDGDLRDDGCTGADLDDRQKWFPSINGTIDTVLFSDVLKLNAQLRADQNQVNSSRGSSDDGLDRNGNTNTFYRYSVSPYTSRRISGNTSFNARYTYSSVINTSDQVSDSNRHSLTSGFNGQLGPRVTWNLNGRYSLTQYNDDLVNRNTGVRVPRKDTEISNMSLKLAYQISRSWQVNGTYGWEWNDFQSSSNRNQGGSAWDVGIKWTPSPRTTVEVGMGDRFFGDTPRISFSHKRKRIAITGDYNKRITFQRDLATVGLDDFGGFDSGGNIGDIGGLPSGGFDENGEALEGLGTDSSISSNSAILDERTTLTAAYTGRPGKVSLFYSYSQQTRAEDGAQADFTDWQLSWNPNLSRRYQISTSLGYEDIEPSGFRNRSFDFDNFTEAEQWYYQLSFLRPLNSWVSVSMEYRYTDRRSDDELAEYQENLVRASLNIQM